MKVRNIHPKNLWNIRGSMNYPHTWNCCLRRADLHTYYTLWSKFFALFLPHQLEFTLLQMFLSASYAPFHISISDFILCYQFDLHCISMLWIIFTFLLLFCYCWCCRCCCCYWSATCAHSRLIGKNRLDCPTQHWRKCIFAGFPIIEWSMDQRINVNPIQFGFSKMFTSTSSSSSPQR